MGRWTRKAVLTRAVVAVDLVAPGVHWAAGEVCSSASSKFVGGGRRVALGPKEAQVMV